MELNHEGLDKVGMEWNHEGLYKQQLVQSAALHLWGLVIWKDVQQGFAFPLVSWV